MNKMEKPINNPTRISVIMGIYNCAPTLAEALDSLLAQSYQGFKVIMCDDGSKDNTVDVAQTYVNTYPDKFILIKNERNMGLNHTLNHCLKYVDTEFVARMDGDDISLPNRFEEQLQFLDMHKKYSIVSTPMIYFDEKGEYRRGIGGYEVTNQTASTGPVFCHAPCMIRSEAYNAVGGYGEGKYLMRVEDVHLWYKLYAKGYKGYVLKEPLYAMRDDRNAVQRRKFKYRINSFLVRWEWIPKVGLPKWRRLYAFYPIMVGLLPQPIYNILHKRK